ncbi:MAG: signal recognition particle-docking protein FtsY [Betaproteobacteria bacterium]|nr:signal recognition particle-docking protein FtsY [Betaproteobacteria bacterium]
MLGFFKRDNKDIAEPGTFEPELPALTRGPHAVVEQKSPKPGWLDRLRHGLRKTGSQLGAILGARNIDEALFEELETALLSSDAGVSATTWLLERLRERARRKKLESAEQLKAELRDLLAELLAPLEKPFFLGPERPTVIMLAGVNGAGKTTSIGKLAKNLQASGHSVVLAAGDTFRAAAREQLAEWGARNNVSVISQTGADPGAVIYDAIQSAGARGTDIVIADTAGRLPTQLHLMEEVSKIKRVIGKARIGAPQEVWLVIDANTGQNALSQVIAFDKALGLTGLIVTKLDGTAKGGILAAIALARSNIIPVRSGSTPALGEFSGGVAIPVRFIGVGEGIDDLQPFRAREFAVALLD